ncbi:MAG: HD domain-containing protein [Candidatus Jacksonbacteria bacterium]|jgi:uncharacterized protein|nr:HD domain-containing protein [Candidatus Jacksonbacteria bacterium]MBT6955023.1 HD domain-containing protein [Candidatus Jacksonbacteria bacterium]MBT7008265.1 HD domain-containing protein [Candidatus Jacksonbacteria bacterium]
MINKTLLHYIIDECPLDDVQYDYHGISHWDRVAQIGEYLCRRADADKDVVMLFAYLHDSKRLPDGHNNIEHGEKASIFAQELYSQGFLSVTDKQLDKLAFACLHHSDGFITSDDITIQACWDSDRLDLWRINMIPDPAYLQTAIGKMETTIDFAKKLNGK